VINSEIQELRNKEMALIKRLSNFKGSKAQRNNAKKDLKKVQEQISELEPFLKKEEQDRIKEEIASIKRRLAEDFVGFWWEVYPLSYRDELLQRKAFLEKSL